MEGRSASILFKGIPGGHEFSSLVLAVLNAAGLGKRPDEGLQNRIRHLKGPVRLRTFVSLSCHNCPEVVQALNQMALIHPDFVHEMVDGGLAESEVEKLGIQGVPTVISTIHENAQVSVGRAGLAELIDALEERYGVEASEAAQDLPAREPYDVVVVGGGPAGASAAIYSVRKGLRTALVAKNVGGQVLETVGIDNLIGTTHTEGKKLAADILAHVRSYPVEILDNRRVEAIENGELKTVRLAGGEVLQAKSLIVATGAQWRELNVAGEKEYIGRGVAFCPHCDGPFYKDKRVVVVGGGNSGIEAAIDLAGICGSVTVVEFMNELKADKVLVDNLKKLPNTADRSPPPDGGDRRRREQGHGDQGRRPRERRGEDDPGRRDLHPDRPRPELRPREGARRREPLRRDRRGRQVPHVDEGDLRGGRRHDDSVQADHHLDGRGGEGRARGLRGPDSRGVATRPGLPALAGRPSVLSRGRSREPGRERIGLSHA